MAYVACGDDVWRALGDLWDIFVLICGFIEGGFVVEVAHELNSWTGRVAGRGDGNSGMSFRERDLVPWMVWMLKGAEIVGVGVVHCVGCGNV